MTTRPGFHVKLVFFDFDVRSSDKCAEADFIQVKTGGTVFNDCTNSNHNNIKWIVQANFSFFPRSPGSGWLPSLILKIDKTGWGKKRDHGIGINFALLVLIRITVDPLYNGHLLAILRLCA